MKKLFFKIFPIGIILIVVVSLLFGVLRKEIFSAVVEAYLEQYVDSVDFALESLSPSQLRGKMTLSDSKGSGDIQFTVSYTLEDLLRNKKVRSVSVTGGALTILPLGAVEDKQIETYETLEAEVLQQTDFFREILINVAAQGKEISERIAELSVSNLSVNFVGFGTDFQGVSLSLGAEEIRLNIEEGQSNFLPERAFEISATFSFSEPEKASLHLLGKDKQANAIEAKLFAENDYLAGEVYGAVSDFTFHKEGLFLDVGTLAFDGSFSTQRSEISLKGNLDLFDLKIENGSTETVSLARLNSEFLLGGNNNKNLKITFPSFSLANLGADLKTVGVEFSIAELPSGFVEVSFNNQNWTEVFIGLPNLTIASDQKALSMERLRLNVKNQDALWYQLKTRSVKYTHQEGMALTADYVWVTPRVTGGNILTFEALDGLLTPFQFKSERGSALLSNHTPFMEEFTLTSFDLFSEDIALRKGGVRATRENETLFKLNLSAPDIRLVSSNVRMQEEIEGTIDLINWEVHLDGEMDVLDFDTKISHKSVFKILNQEFLFQFQSPLKAKNFSKKLLEKHLGLDMAIIGKVGAEGRIHLKEGRWASSGKFLLTDAFLESPAINLSSVTGVIEFRDLINVTTKKNQQIFIGITDVGLPLTNGILTFEIDKGRLLNVKEASWDMLGGRLFLEPFEIGLNSPNYRFNIVAQSLSLSDLVDRVELKGLSATGLLSGEIPFRVEGAEIYIDEAVLENPHGGVIFYKPNQASEFASSQSGNVDILFSALENFHYDRLAFTLAGDTKTGMTAAMGIKGNNPNLYGGYPIDFNLSLTGELDLILKQNLSIHSIPANIQDKVEEFYTAN